MKIQCVACGFADADLRQSERYIPYGEEIIYHIYSCPLCNTEFAWPRASGDIEFYESTIYNEWRWEFNEVIRDLEYFQTKYGRKLKLLEIGCGEGFLLEALSKDFESYGIDFNSLALTKAKNRNPSLNISCHSLKEFSSGYPDSKFDSIILFHVIEHVENPLDVLGDIYNSLSDDGLLFVALPNPERSMLRIHREMWDYPPHHLTRFSNRGFITLLKRANFIVEKQLIEPFNSLDLSKYYISSVKTDLLFWSRAKVDVRKINSIAKVFVKSPSFILFYILLSIKEGLFKFRYKLPNDKKSLSGLSAYFICRKVSR